MSEDVDMEPRTEQPMLSTLLPASDGNLNTFQRLKEESILADIELSFQNIFFFMKHLKEVFLS